MNFTMRNITVLMLVIGAATNAVAEERIDLQKDTVVGSQEAPKALYIVPWRPLTPTDFSGLQIETLLDEELEYIDPESFKRKVNLHAVVNSDKAIK